RQRELVAADQLRGGGRVGLEGGAGAERRVRCQAAPAGKVVGDRAGRPQLLSPSNVQSDGGGDRGLTSGKREQRVEGAREPGAGEIERLLARIADAGAREPFVERQLKRPPRVERAADAEADAAAAAPLDEALLQCAV